MRHHDVTRVEGFSDAVFAFAVTLLVVSLEVPTEFSQLHSLIRESGTFALMFAMVCWIWYEHNLFFRRYGLQDGWTIFLNCVLLFVVLFYVYPLKFLTRQLLGGTHFKTMAEGREVMLLYSAGVVMIFATFCILYSHAWRRRTTLTLTSLDVVHLKSSFRRHLITTAIGLLSVVIAVVNEAWTPIAGFIYFLLGPALTWNGFVSGKAERALQAQSPRQ